ncbi:vacuolar protein sorting-associated protein, Vps51/Vps67 family protein [Ceratobasidium sp. AG-Ba]|nr:vacuolar protein sorting-associated protein, Vps51/Vps67 family protein [Ceratobasidium sp. AG-Ba]
MSNLTPLNTPPATPSIQVSPTTAPVTPTTARPLSRLASTPPITADSPVTRDPQRLNTPDLTVPLSPLPPGELSPVSPGLNRPRGSGRARDLLRKHYGLGVAAATGSLKSRDPMDLDSPNFDAKAYYEHLITTATLPELLKKENELMLEIKQLDGERQSLVYNHHHELIAASDTIHAMKTRAESLDVDLDRLMSAFSEISRLSAEVAVEPHD